jgi:AhpD family alkylhydroperoxidase
MREWIRYSKVAPEGFQALLRFDEYVRQCGLEKSLLELVRIRVSQINGCGYCIDIHTKDARAEGETEQRLHCLSAWCETQFYSDRERPALAWAEAVITLRESQVPDDVYQGARTHFSHKELVDLTMAVIAINSMNWLAVSLNTPAGSYHRNSPVTIQKAPELGRA